MELKEAVVRRRSVRKFKSTPIAEDILLKMLTAAQLAPSGGNGQSHLFGVVNDEATKLELARAAGNQMWIAQAPVIFACCAELDGLIADLPADDFGLVVNKLRFGDGFIDYLRAYPDKLAVQTLFDNSVPLIPAEHICLTAVAHGLSACFIGYLDVKRAGKILHLPPNRVCLFLLPVGYSDEIPRPIRRKAIEEISFRNTFHA